MLTFRQRDISGHSVEERLELRALANEFPGALRELDRLPTEEIIRRRNLLAEDKDEPWIDWMHSYHLLCRQQLAAKGAGSATRKSAGLNVTVFAELERRFSVSAAEIRAALFPGLSTP